MERIIVVSACALAVISGASAQPAWQMAAPIPKAIGEIEAAAVTGKIYVLSGLDNRPGVVAPAGLNWAYDPSANSWTDRKPMPVPAHHIMVATANDKIYVFGGFVRPAEVVAWQPINRSFEYDPATDTWRELAPMPTPRGAGQAVEVGGKIYVIGGARSNKADPGAPIPLGSTDQIVVGTVEEYNPATDHWTYAGRAPTTRGDCTGQAHNGRLYIAGGEFQDTERKMTFWGVEVFNPKSGLWSTLPHIQVARHDFAAAFLGDKLHVMGGGFQSDGMPGVDPTTATHEVTDLAAE